MDLTPELAESQVQALLIVCHSTLAAFDFLRLKQAQRRGARIISDASSWQQKTWTKMQDVAHRLQSEPSGMLLSDVLVEWKAQQSSLAAWPKFGAGSNYIASTAPSRRTLQT